MKYVLKKPVFEAFQYGVDAFPHWFPPHASRFIKEFKGKDVFEYNGSLIAIDKEEMVVREPNGMLHSVKKDIFDETYEPYGEGE